MRGSLSQRESVRLRESLPLVFLFRLPPGSGLSDTPPPAAPRLPPARGAAKNASGWSGDPFPRAPRPVPPPPPTPSPESPRFLWNRPRRIHAGAACGEIRLGSGHGRARRTARGGIWHSLASRLLDRMSPPPAPCRGFTASNPCPLERGSRFRATRRNGSLVPPTARRLVPKLSQPFAYTLSVI